MKVTEKTGHIIIVPHEPTGPVVFRNRSGVHEIIRILDEAIQVVREYANALDKDSRRRPSAQR